MKKKLFYWAVGSGEFEGGRRGDRPPWTKLLQNWLWGGIGHGL